MIALPVAILCGGLGTRMRPLTETIPKALIPVAGEPFIAHLLRLLASHGVTHVVLCVSYLGHEIEAFVGDGSRFGVSARFSHDGPERAGTAGAVRRALPLLGDRFLLVYGDSYLPVAYGDIADAFVRGGRSVLMTVWQNHDRLAPSNVRIHAGRIVEYRKNADDPAFTFIDYGVGAFTREAFDQVPHDAPADLALVVRRAIDAGSIEAYEIFERFYEIGSPQGLEETERYLRSHAVILAPEDLP